MTKEQKDLAETIAKANGVVAAFNIKVQILLLIIPYPASYHEPYIPPFGLYIINIAKQPMNNRSKASKGGTLYA